MGRLTFITKNSTREEILEAYKAQVEKNKRINRIHKSKLKKKEEKIIHQQGRIKKLRYDNLKLRRLVWGKNVHLERNYKYVERLRQSTLGTISKSRAKAKKEALEEALNQITHRDFRMISFSRFMMMSEYLANAVGLDSRALGFLMWAGSYDFFALKDFKRDIPQSVVSYYRCLSRSKKLNYITELEEVSSGNRKMYAVTKEGRDTLDSVHKFVEAQYKKIQKKNG